MDIKNKHFHFKEDLYLASSEIFQEVITDADNDYETIALFSHNEGITYFANRYAPLRAHQKITGIPMGYMDTRIAAHALAENLALVTNNERHYGRVDGLQLVNWAVP